MGKLDALDIPYGSIHKIEYADLGRCLDNGISCYKGVFDIQISNLFKKAGIDMLDLKATVMHELLHTCAGCGNHDGKWREYAALAESAYHYEILGFRTCQQVFLKEKEKEIIHKLSCPNCEGFWNIRDERLWEMVVRDEDYGCLWCGERCMAVE